MKKLAHNILTIDDRIFTSYCVTVAHDSFYWGPSMKTYVTAQDTMRGRTFYTYINVGFHMREAIKTDRLPHHYFHSFKSI